MIEPDSRGTIGMTDPGLQHVTQCNGVELQIFAAVLFRHFHNLTEPIYFDDEVRAQRDGWRLGHLQWMRGRRASNHVPAQKQDDRRGEERYEEAVGDSHRREVNDS